MSRCIALLLAILMLATPVHGLAQSSATDGVVLQEATGGVWAVAAFELELAIFGAIIAIQESSAGDDERERWCTGACASLLVGLLLAVPIGVGVAAQLEDVPADAPFVLHNGVWGGVSGMLVGAGIASVSGASEGTVVGAGIAGAIAGAGLVGTYAFARRRDLVDDPDLGVASHLMMWVPSGILLTFGAIFLFVQAINPNPERFWPAMLVLGLVGMALYGGAIALAEGLRAGRDEPAATTAPLGAWTMSL